MPIVMTQRYQCTPDVLFQEVDGELVLLDMNAEAYYGLNETGARVWQLLQSGETPVAIVDILQDEFEVDAASLTTDVAELIASLEEAGLVQASATRAGSAGQAAET